MKCDRCSGRLQGPERDKLETRPAALFSDSLGKFLRSTYYKHLCDNCLTEIAPLVIKAEEIKHKRQQNKFIENTHYYIEGGNMVYTELYHILKGYCCQNCCRHCAYGFIGT